MDANRLIELARDCGMFVSTEMWWQLDRWERLSAAVTAEMGNNSPAEVESLRKDAERYRWLRTAGAWESEIGMDVLSQSPDLFDAAVDAAMED